ncbi:MAG: hypothetical protein R2911_21250 [Caldilineaceae bacterium]
MTAEKRVKLNTTSALITVALYLVGSIVAGLLAAIFLGRRPRDTRRVILTG